MKFVMEDSSTLNPPNPNDVGSATELGMVPVQTTVKAARTVGTVIKKAMPTLHFMANPSGSCSPAREWTSVASAGKMVVNPGEVPTIRSRSRSAFYLRIAFVEPSQEVLEMRT